LTKLLLYKNALSSLFFFDICYNIQMEKDTDKMRGGKRLNAGRKTGSGKYGEPTSVVRVPESQKANIVSYLSHYQDRRNVLASSNVDSFESSALEPISLALPLFTSKVRAGFPSPADDHVEKRLDVSEYLIQQADATFFVTITGDSMRDAGLLSGDKAVVDRSKQASVGDIVMAVIDGEFTIKTLGKTKTGRPRLIPANPDYPVINITEEMSFEIWGVVTGSFRRF
jgi:DNA polymerase V